MKPRTLSHKASAFWKNVLSWLNG